MQDLWLLKIERPGQATDTWIESIHVPAEVQSWQATDGQLSYLYARADLSSRFSISGETGNWSPLTCLQEIPGDSAGQIASYHYIVETDVLPEFEDDLNAWYAQEHLPGLAAVPGTIRAARYTHTAGSPRYYACYDLLTPDSLNHPAWLAVRGSAWSSRVRPAFTNTRRTMFRKSATTLR